MPEKAPTGPVPPSPTPTPIAATVTAGLLNVPTPSSGGNVVGVWGYEGSLVNLPEETSTPPFTCGVLGQGEHGGVVGTSAPGSGVHGVNGAGTGTKPVYGCGVWGESDNGYGVYGASKTASGVYGTSPAGHFAGEFEGDVQVSGSVSVGSNVSVAGDVILTGSDCAEQFDTAGKRRIEPGSVVVIDGEGTLCESHQAYDKKVAGVVWRRMLQAWYSAWGNRRKAHVNRAGRKSLLQGGRAVWSDLRGRSPHDVSDGRPCDEGCRS